MKETVSVVEVGPRDGLQNEAVLLPPRVKIAFIQALILAGHKKVEATAFVSPHYVPQLADAEEVLAGVGSQPGVTLSALVPNLKGFQRAIKAGVNEVAVFTAASESFTARNINATIAESLERFQPVLQAAQAAAIPVRAYLSTVLHCPFEGRVDLGVSVSLVGELLEMGCFQVSLGETMGRANPREVEALCGRLAAEGLLPRCAGHFHDTYGLGLANVVKAYECGIRTFDSSAGGLGGCPYAPGAAGNVATEDLLNLFAGLGVETGVDLMGAVKAARLIEEALAHPLPGRTYRALVS